MGLAASQARLLTITARKSDCEFLSMSLSHQKLSLARDMERVSSDYQNALSQTKLVYDYYGTGDTSINLDYGLLMTPSVYNDYYPKTVTDAENKVILNSSYAAAARAAGIPVEGLEGTPSDSVRNSFIEALAGAGVITASRAASIESVTYGNSIGLGSTSNVTASYTQVSYDELIDMIEASTGGTSTLDYGLNFSMTRGETNSEGDNYLSLNIGGEGLRLRTFDKNGNEKSTVGKVGEDNSINLKTLLTGDDQFVLYLKSPEGAATPITEAAYLQQLICGSDNGRNSFSQYLVDMFSSVLGGVKSNETALQYAANAVYDLIYPNSEVQTWANGVIALDGGKYVTSTDRKDHGGDHLDRYASGENNGEMRDSLTAMSANQVWQYDRKHPENVVSENALGSVGVSLSYCSDACSRDQYQAVAVNLNTLAKVFLTAFVEYQEGIDSTSYAYERGSKDAANLYDPNRSDFQFTIAGQTEVDSDDDNLYANFYDALFNQICMNGWTENEQIEDVDYMTDLFKNGLAFISSIAEDGYYYQGSYSTDRAILEVSDESAIAVAEAKYNTEKAKIENKEDTLDMKMKNLDTEISSLTTEYDSTKQIITKAVEKSFKRYEA